LLLGEPLKRGLRAALSATVQQLPPRDGAAALLGEMEQHAQRRRLQVDELAGAAQLVAREVELAVAEAESNAGRAAEPLPRARSSA
jgi:hypothetical protein